MKTKQTKPHFCAWMSLIILQIGTVTAAELDPSSAKVEVSAFNYIQAKTELQFDKYLKSADGKINTFAHTRSLVKPSMKSSKRLNRDTLYSVAVVDISEGAKLTIPSAGDRYLSVQAINQKGYTNQVFYKAGDHNLLKSNIGTDYVLLLVRILVSESISGDLELARELQDQLHIKSRSAEPFIHSAYDKLSFDKTTELLLALGKQVKSNRGAAGSKDEVDPVKQLIVSAYGFGTLPDKDSLLINVEPQLPADGAYSLTIKDVPVDGFWSVAVYNTDGYFEVNDLGIYGYSDRSAVRNPDGSISLNFGGDPKSVNHIPISEGWNYVVRLYRPKKSLLDGTWTFPGLKPVVR